MNAMMVGRPKMEINFYLFKTEIDLYMLLEGKKCAGGSGGGMKHTHTHIYTYFNKLYAHNKTCSLVLFIFLYCAYIESFYKLQGKEITYYLDSL